MFRPLLRVGETYMTAKNKTDSIQNIVQIINKKLKTNISIGNSESLEIQRIETGMPSMD